MYLIRIYTTIITAINVSSSSMFSNIMFLPNVFNTPFVARALMTNGNENAEKLG